MSGVCCCKTRAAREEELPTLSVYVLRVLISLPSSVRALWQHAGLQQQRQTRALPLGELARESV